MEEREGVEMGAVNLVGARGEGVIVVVAQEVAMVAGERVEEEMVVVGSVVVRAAEEMGVVELAVAMAVAG